MKTWCYHLSNDKPGEGWACIILAENGMFSAVSDWGNYAKLWTHTGCKDFREFFLSAERDWEYFAHKLRPEKILNEEASFKTLKGEILRQRRTKDLTKDQAENAWGALSYYDTWAAYLESSECTDAFEEAWDFSVYDLHQDVVAFCKRVLPRLAETLKAELMRPTGPHVLDIVLARKREFYITEEARKALPILNDAWVRTMCDVRGDKLYPYKFSWKGVERDIEQFIETLKAFEGTAELIVLWDTGERSGYRLNSHRVTSHAVDFLLV